MGDFWAPELHKWPGTSCNSSFSVPARTRPNQTATWPLVSNLAQLLQTGLVAPALGDPPGGSAGESPQGVPMGNPPQISQGHPWGGPWGNPTRTYQTLPLPVRNRTCQTPDTSRPSPTPADPTSPYQTQLDRYLATRYREAGITWARMSRNYMVSEKWSSWEVVVFPSDHF